MVCIRCKVVVTDILNELQVPCNAVELGEVELRNDLSPIQQDQLRVALLRSGLELLDDHKSIFIQKIKTIIIEQVHYEEEALHVNLSVFLSNKLHYNYTYLANLFSEVTGMTIEKFYIMHKIEKVKELLVYNELTLTEIAFKMHYSSVAHISNQFKKVTGLSPSHFKKLKIKRRSVLETLGSD